MAVTASPRLGLTRWSAGSDLFRRTQLDADHGLIDANVALYRHGTFNARPAAGVEGRFYYVTTGASAGTIYYDNGSAWTDGIVLGNDTRLSDARPPTAHTHSAADVTSGVFGTARLGTGTANAGTYLRGDGTWAGVSGGSLSALSDVALASPATAQFLRFNGTAWANAAIADADLPGTIVRTSDTRLTDARTPTAHSHGIADLPVASSGASSATALVRADDSRLANARTPTTHATTHATGGSDPITPANIGAAAASHSHGIADLPVATSGTSSATQLVRADDTRLSDARTPTTHTHSPNVQRIVFTTAGTARPTGTTYVEWVGPVAPTNALDGDTWISTV